MKYDDASWHYGGDFPAELESINGATHMAMFLAWCLLNGLAGDLHRNEFSEDLEALTNREKTPARWFIANCDEKFTDEDLNAKGNRFAMHYYDNKESPFYEDYENAVGSGVESLYHVEDSWVTFDKLAPIFERRFKEWLAVER